MSKSAVNQIIEYCDALLPDETSRGYTSSIHYLCQAGWKVQGLIGAQEESKQCDDDISRGPVFSTVLNKRNKSVNCDLNGNSVVMSAELMIYDDLTLGLLFATGWQESDEWVKITVNTNIKDISKTFGILRLLEWYESKELSMKSYRSVI